MSEEIVELVAIEAGRIAIMPVAPAGEPRSTDVAAGIIALLLCPGSMHGLWQGRQAA